MTLRPSKYTDTFPPRVWFGTLVQTWLRDLRTLARRARPAAVEKRLHRFQGLTSRLDQAPIWTKARKVLNSKRGADSRTALTTLEAKFRVRGACVNLAFYVTSLFDDSGLPADFDSMSAAMRSETLHVLESKTGLESNGIASKVERSAACPRRDYCD